MFKNTKNILAYKEFQHNDIFSFYIIHINRHTDWLLWIQSHLEEWTICIDLLNKIKCGVEEFRLFYRPCHFRIGNMAERGETEWQNTRFTLPIPPCTEYSVKLLHLLTYNQAPRAQWTSHRGSSRVAVILDANRFHFLGQTCRLLVVIFCKEYKKINATNYIFIFSQFIWINSINRTHNRHTSSYSRTHISLRYGSHNF